MASDTDLQTSIAEQAAHWWVMLNSEERSPNELAAFTTWVTQSPERISAYLRTAMLVKATKSCVRWPDTPTVTLVSEAKSSIGPESHLSHEAWRRSVPASRNINLGISRRFVLATMSAVIGAVAIIWFVSAGAQVFQTGFGERRSILLADGSRVTLNSESRIEVKLAKNQRSISLLSGEALFSVAHDPKRAFLVQVGSAEIRDIGTQFDVDRRPDQTTVTVVEGRIAVAPLPEARAAGSAMYPQPQTRLLATSDQLVITPAQWQATRHGVELRATVAWTENKLIFAHTPLKEVAQEFNRYNRQRIQIESEQLQRQEITGTFRSDDPKSLLSFLSGITGVSIHDTPDGNHDVVQN
jgi:transmembrane sensor